MKSKDYSFGMITYRGKLRITNRQNHVEWEELDGYSCEREARSCAGNFNKDLYDYDYSGYYYDRKKAIQRMEYDVEATEKLLEELKFSLKVTKKKNWIKTFGETYDK